MGFGRPTEYTEEMLCKAIDYVQSFAENGCAPNNPIEVFPSIVGLCKHINRSKSIVYDWAKHKDKSDFSDILSCVNELQEVFLLNKGLNGEFNPAVTKMILSKHGYSDKVEQDHKSSDGTMSPTRIELVAPGDHRED